MTRGAHGVLEDPSGNGGDAMASSSVSIEALEALDSHGGRLETELGGRLQSH